MTPSFLRCKGTTSCFSDEHFGQDTHIAPDT